MEFRNVPRADNPADQSDRWRSPTTALLEQLGKQRLGADVCRNVDDLHPFGPHLLKSFRVWTYEVFELPTT